MAAFRGRIHDRSPIACRNTKKPLAERGPSIHDVLGNLAVLLAALGVFGTGTGWPDIIVAAIMALLALQGSVTVMRHALAELKPPAAATA
jgi:Co/Zn/Cd efflux system component